MDQNKLKKQLRQLKIYDLDTETRLKDVLQKKVDLERDLEKVRFGQRILAKLHEETFKAFIEGVSNISIPLSLKGTDAEVKEYREKTVDLLGSVGVDAKVLSIDQYKEMFPEAKFTDTEVNNVVLVQY